MKKRIILLLIVLLLSSGLHGCANSKATITTTVYPVKYIVEYLAAEKVEVEYLSTDVFIQRATVVDNYKEILSKTTLFVYLGGLEPYMDIYPDLLTDCNFEVINLASLSAIYDFARYTTHLVNNVSVTTQSAYYEDDLFKNVDIYDKDPFVWLDPIAMSSMALTIKEWLCSYYPEDTLNIENRFKELQQTLVRMDAEYQDLSKIKDVKIVTVTASFGTWQKDYGVEVYPLILSKYGVLPTDEQLAVIEQTIKDNNVKFIVHDDTLPEDMQMLYEKVMNDLKLTPIEMSSLSRLGEDDLEKDKAYTTIMYENLTNLEKAFK